jgi:putative oxidoreductase
MIQMLSPNMTGMARGAAILVARLLFAGVFAMALFFKLRNIDGTAAYIAAEGLPMSLVLACAAALFEIFLVAAFLTGSLFTEASLAAAIYVIFLGVVFHGPAHWAKNGMEFGFFVDHFVFLAGLLFAAVHGPGRLFILSFSPANR